MDGAGTSRDSQAAGGTGDESSGRTDIAERRAEEASVSDGLARLMELTTQLDSDNLLVQVASYAVTAIPGADGAGLTLVVDGRPDTVAASAQFVTDLDAVQYEIGQGPCITAAIGGRTVVAGSLSGDPRWRQLGGMADRLGVHSALALPLLTTDGVIGALNVYAYRRYVFDERAAELAQTYAVPAAVAVVNAHVLAEARRLTIRLRSALEAHGVIDRAVGILMSRTGGTADQALVRLRVLGQHDEVELQVVAEQIIDEAVRRAHSSHSEEH